MKNFKELLRNIKAMVFDVDGVLTDGTLLLMPDGELIRTMNIRDGIVMKLAVKKGYHLCIITGGNNMAVKQRLNRLGITDVYLKTENKWEAMKEFLATYDLKTEEVLYMGDDLVDHEVMTKIGVPTCPKDAVPEIKAISVYVSGVNGGKGCVRDVVEQVMKLHGKWEIPKW
ncbi:MAG TPA: HAD hydrolase family protein [Bacteroidia bacterium]|jgi:3-deoxy-D-manno-octulosonate 8-phosphate phosphatase (KDO 8-P phosphatase)|nr:HAD hydrolase family protein [Bacteroidia bacterium]